MKVSFLTLLAVVFFSSQSHAEPTPPKMFNIRTNPINYFLYDINADIDVRLIDRLTVGPYFSLWKGTANLTTSGSSTTQAVDYTFLMTGARFNVYLTGPAISDSFYLSPLIGYANFKVSDATNASGSVSGLNLGGLFGYQWVWPSGFNLSLGAGISSYLMSSTLTMSDGRTVTVPSYALIIPNIDLTLGFAF